MDYKTILVCLTNAHNADRLCRLAIELARKFDAHLVGLHTLQSVLVYPGIALRLSNEFEKAFTDVQLDEAKQIEKIFRTLTEAEEFPSEWRCEQTKSVSAANVILEHSRCADLVILPQADSSHDRPDQRTLQQKIVEEAGRPVLIIPSFGSFDIVGENVLVGWSATKEATRSAHDALPFLKQAKHVDFYSLSRAKEDDTSLQQSALEIANTMARHGVEANVVHGTRTELPIGDEILNRAFDRGMDLIVIGAYGHSRMYDFLVGATTQHLMRHMTVPVLFSC